MKVGRGRAKSSRSKGSTVAVENDRRLAAAGRPGTKRFVDPLKVFVGNLAYDATEDDLVDFLTEHLIGKGADRARLRERITSVKVVRDWRTNESKGYGFVQFASAIFATSALEAVRNKKLKGRVVRLDQGQKKRPDPVVLVERKRRAPVDEESRVIDGALDDAEGKKDDDAKNDVDDNDSNKDDDDGLFVEDDDGLVVDNTSFEELLSDAVLFAGMEDDEEDDDDFEFDGVYKEEYLDDEEEEEAKPLNRAQRREAAKSKKKRRKPANGFGN